MRNQDDTNDVKDNKKDANNEHTGGHSSSFPFLENLGSNMKRSTRVFKPVRNIKLLELADDSSSESPPPSPPRQEVNDKKKKKDVDNILNTSFIESSTQNNIKTVDIQSKLNDSFIESSSSKSLTDLFQKCSLDNSDLPKDLLILNDNSKTDECLINNITGKSYSVQKTNPDKNSVIQLDNLKYQTPRNDSSSKLTMKHDMFRTPLLRQHSVLSMIKERSSSAMKERSIATCLFKKDNSFNSVSKQNTDRSSLTTNKTNSKFSFSNGEELNRDFDIRPLEIINEDLQGVKLKRESIIKTSNDRKRVLNENNVETNSEAWKCNEKQENDTKQMSVEKENVTPVSVQFNVKSIGSKTIHPKKLKADKLISEMPTELPRENVPKPVAEQKQNVQFSLPMPTVNNKQFQSIVIKGKAYTVLSKLGEGGSSQVYQVLEPETSLIYAVKCVNLTSSLVACGCMNEIQLLSKLQGSDRVIKMFDYEHVEKDKLLYVLMEKGDTDLTKLLRNSTSSQTAHLPTPMIIYYWTEILAAVKYIHDNGIIHSDLKPSNFLLVMGRLKLIDFGISSCVQAEMTSVIKNTQTGTYHYISPETLMDTQNDDATRSPLGRPRIKISYKSDVWSLGCILYNLIYRCTPFQHLKNQWVVLAAIVNPKHQIHYPEAPHCPPILMETLKRCLTFEPKRRPTVTELLEIPYISFKKTV